MLQRSWLHRQDHAATWLNIDVTIAVNVHEKMSEILRKGASGRQLRYNVRARSGIIYCRYNINAPKKEGTAEFEFLQTYKSQWGIHQKNCGVWRSKLLCLPVSMELLNFDTHGVSLGFLIWPTEM